LRKQINILNGIHHPNVVGIKEHFDLESALVLILELQEGGEVVNNLISSTDEITEDTARKIIKQILLVVDILHSKNIIHKSLLPQNLLLSKKGSGDIKITGFSLSQETKEDKEVAISGGDPGFLAPELINQQEYGRPVDMWSIGVLTYIFLSGSRPFEDTNIIRLNNKIRQGTFEFPDKEWGKIDQEAKNFVKGLLEVDASKRLTVKQALDHPWLKKSGGASLPHVRANLVNST